MATVRLARLTSRQAAITAFLTSPAGPMWRTALARGIRVQNLARSYVRVDTGTLRASIGVAQSVASQKIITSVGSNIEYAPFVGTRLGPHGHSVVCYGAYLPAAFEQAT